MAHKRLYGVCYSDCSDNSHYDGEDGEWLDSYSFFQGSLKRPIVNDETFYWKSQTICSLDDFKKLQGKIKETEKFKGYFSLDVEEEKLDKLNTSFSNVPGAKIKAPKEKYEEVKESTLVPDDLVMASQFSHLINKFNSDLNYEKVKYDSSLNLAKTKEMIEQTELLKQQNIALTSISKVLGGLASQGVKNNKIQEAIAKKSSSFNNTANITNTFDSEFATTLGTALGDSLKPVLEKQTESLSNIEKYLKSQETYFKNLTDKNITHNGKQYSKMEIDNLISSGTLVGIESENSFDMEEVMEFIDDALSDGFDLNYNPFEKMLDLLKDEYDNEEKEIKLKYNL